MERYFIAGCIEDDTSVMRCENGETPEFWTLYKRVNIMGMLVAEAIADFKTESDAVEMLKRFNTPVGNPKIQGSFGFIGKGALI